MKIRFAARLAAGFGTAAAALALVGGVQPAAAVTKLPVKPAPAPKWVAPRYVPPPVVIDYRAPIAAALGADRELLVNTHGQVGASLFANERQQERLAATVGDSNVSALVARREAGDLEARLTRVRAIHGRLEAARGQLDATYAALQAQSGILYARPVADAQVDAASAGQELSNGVAAALAAIATEAATEADDAGLSRPQTMAWPESGFEISQGFGPSDLAGEPPFGGFDHFHLGIDLAAPEGTAVNAPAGGVVVLTGTPTSYGRYMGFGNYVVVDFGGGLTAIFGHLDEIKVAAGDHLEGGQLIGLEGSTGYSTGPHLHFEVHVNGQPIDPSPYMK